MGDGQLSFDGFIQWLVFTCDKRQIQKVSEGDRISNFLSVSVTIC
jgi:hypothetical protein